jgi:two-component system cell cycle sensor histidine kinase/response regulator CckA
MESRSEILIVDDDVELALNLQDILEDRGYGVAVAHSGQTACVLSREKIFDLALVDIKLPDILGNKLIDQLTALSPRTEFILVTGYASLESAVEAVRKKRIVSYESKPIDIDRLLSVINQVIKRRRAEESLKKSEKRYEQFVENLNEGIWVIDKDAYTRFVNRRMAEMLGYKVEDMMGKHLSSFMDERGGEVCKHHLQRWNGGIREQCNLEFLQKDGRRTYTTLEAGPIMDDEGNSIGAIAAVIDITERQRAEEALRESESILRSFFESPGSMRGIIELTNDDLLHISDNTLASTFFRKPKECMRNRFSTELGVPEEVIDIWIGHCEESRQKEQAVRFEYVHPTESEDRHFSAVVSYLGAGASGRPRFAYVMDDITEQKQSDKKMKDLQEQLLHSQKMEAIGLLAGGFAHDFNNSLTLIKVCSQLGLFDLKEGDPLREKFEMIYKATDHSARLANQLLVFSRRQVMEMKVLDLNNLLRELDKMLRRVIGEDIELVNILAENLGRVKVDPSQIEQVVLNLALNARDAMPHGGKLTIETANVRLDDEYDRGHMEMAPGSYVMLMVGDTGVGMTEEVKNRIFEPFFTTKRNGSGTGLGLSVVYGIVKQSGGYIRVYSEPGEGSTFKFYLPRVDGPLDEENKTGFMEYLPSGSETLLLVEDEKEVRTLMTEILKRQGYQVLAAANAGEALLLYEQHQGPIHLILTDVIMPGMGGPALVEHLRAVKPEMKAIFMSGYSDKRMPSDDGRNINFIQKPFSLERLARKVRQVLES